MKIWRERPPSSSPSARTAWDMLSDRHAPWKIVKVWYAPEMDDGAWCAEFDGGEYRDVDVLEVKYLRDVHKIAVAGKKLKKLELELVSAKLQLNTAI